jgi:hypothetical protein
MSYRVQICGWFSAAMAPGVGGLPHLAHAALADGGEDFVRAEFVTCRERHDSDSLPQIHQRR